MNRNDLLTIAQRLREYVRNPHHVNPMSDAFRGLIDEAIVALSASAEPSARRTTTPNPECALCQDLGDECMTCETQRLRSYAALDRKS